MPYENRIHTIQVDDNTVKALDNGLIEFNGKVPETQEEILNAMNILVKAVISLVR